MLSSWFRLIVVLMTLAVVYRPSNAKPSTIAQRLTARCPPPIPMQSFVCDMGKRPGSWYTCSAHNQCIGGMICCLNGCGVKVCQFPAF